MHQQKSPQHPELREGIVTRLYGTHAFLPEKADANVGCFDHGDIVGSIPNRQSNLIKPSPDYPNHFSLLNGKEPAANNSLAVFGQVG